MPACLAYANRSLRATRLTLQRQHRVRPVTPRGTNRRWALPYALIKIALCTRVTFLELGQQTQKRSLTSCDHERYRTSRVRNSGGQQTGQALDKRAADGAFNRPNFRTEFGLRLVEQALEPGASMAVIARSNNINANLLLKWRRLVLAVGDSSQHTTGDLDHRRTVTLKRMEKTMASVGKSLRTMVEDWLAPGPTTR